MGEIQISIRVKVFSGLQDLAPADEALMQAAKNALLHAYAPYSQFNVAAAVLLENGEVLTGTNQENASYPAGLCAEGTVFSAASAMYPNIAVKKLAVTVHSEKHLISRPVSPCGICRQRILEYENRYNSDIQIFMMGEEGQVYSVNSVKDLMPLSFSKDSL